VKIYKHIPEEKVNHLHGEINKHIPEEIKK